MKAKNSRPSGQFRWYIILVCLGTAVVATTVILGTIYPGRQADWTLQIVWLAVNVGILIAIVRILLTVLKKLDALAEDGARLEKIAGTLEKNRSVLSQINHAGKLSETAKSIAYRDADRQSLREAVFDKLQQQDFDATFQIIDEISCCRAYETLAEQLRAEANRYRDATDRERENQVIAHIERLFETHQWTRASAMIERLIVDYQNSEKAKAMRQTLFDKKQERKKILLAAWDDAVKRQDTDRSLEILKELDLYLTPNEGLALQEAARDVFKNKLHSLGVRFSLAVSEKKWRKAMRTGRDIIHDFPNSKMAGEIREKIDILKQKIQ